jgi:hypothetical protein
MRHGTACGANPLTFTSVWTLTIELTKSSCCTDPMGVYADDLESMAAVDPDASPDLLAALANATDVWGPKVPSVLLS